MKTKFRISALFWPALAWLALAARPAEAGDRWTQYTDFSAITCLADAGSHLWLGAYGGLIRVDKSNRATAYFNQVNSGLTDANIRALASDGGGRIWAVTHAGSLVESDGHTWTRLTEGPTSPLKGQRALDVGSDVRGTLWVLAQDDKSGQLSLFRRKSGTWIRVYPKRPLPGYGIYGTQIEMGVDWEGNAWLFQPRSYSYTPSHRLFRYSVQGEVDSIPIPDKLDPVHLITPRSEPPFWLCVRKVARPSPAGWDTVPLPYDWTGRNAPANHAYARLADGTEYWSLGSQFLKYRDGKWEELAAPGFDSYDRFLLTPAGSHDLLVARGGKASLLSAGAWSPLKTEKLSSNLPPISHVLTLKGRSDRVVMGYNYTAASFDAVQGALSPPFDLESRWGVYRSIEGMAEDGKGRIWIRSQHALARVEGSAVTVYDERDYPALGPNTSVRGSFLIAADTRGSVWTGGGGGLLAIPEDAEPKAWKEHPLPGTHAGYAATAVCAHGDGSVWMAAQSEAHYSFRTHGIVARRSGNTWRIFDSTAHPWIGREAIDELLADGRGHVWARLQAGLLQWDGYSWRQHPRHQSPYFPNGITAMAVESSGRLWVAASPADGALVTWNADRWEAVPDSRTKLGRSSIRSMAFDAANRLWMATGGDGILVLDPYGAATALRGQVSGARPAVSARNARAFDLLGRATPSTRAHLPIFFGSP